MTMSPLLAVVCAAGDHEVAVEDADLDHRVAADPQHEQVAVAGEVFGEREQLLDVLLGQHVGAGRDVADERHVARPGDARWPRPDDGSKRTSMARGLVGSRGGNPMRCSEARWLWTVDGEVSPTASPISRTLGG